MLGGAGGKSETAAPPRPAALGPGGPGDLPRGGQRFQHVFEGTGDGPLAPRRSEFRHNLVSLGHQHGLAGLGQPDVFREFRLELFDPDDLHVVMVVTGGHRVNACNTHVETSGDLMSMVGSTLPFPLTRDEQERTRDPRPSIQERYGDRATYLARMREALGPSVAARHVLAEDVDAIVERAGQLWDFLHGGR